MEWIACTAPVVPPIWAQTGSQPLYSFRKVFKSTFSFVITRISFEAKFENAQTKVKRLQVCHLSGLLNRLALGFIFF